MKERWIEGMRWTEGSSTLGEKLKVKWWCDVLAVKVDRQRDGQREGEEGEMERRNERWTEGSSTLGEKLKVKWWCDVLAVNVSSCAWCSYVARGRFDARRTT